MEKHVITSRIVKRIRAGGLRFSSRGVLGRFKVFGYFCC
jgi:hypothetical protein